MIKAELINRLRGLKKTQKGMTGTQVCLLLVGIAFAVSCMLTMLPIYMDDMSVSSSMEGVHKDLVGKDIYQITNEEIKSRIDKYLQVSAVSNEPLKSFKVVRDGGRVLVTMNYEIRDNLIGNIDVVIFFKHEVDFAKPPVED